MLRSLASGVSGLADSLSPLYRSPEEQLSAAWGKASAALHQAASAASNSAAVSPWSDVDVRWCSAALLRSLNQMADALRRDSLHSQQHRSQHTARTASHSATTSPVPAGQPQHSQLLAVPPLLVTNQSLPLPSTAVAGLAALSPPAALSSQLSPSSNGRQWDGSATRDLHSAALPSSPVSSSASVADSENGCVSYLLHESVLEQVCAIGVDDRPAGMRSLVVRTVDALLSCPHSSPLLCYPAVYAALVRLLTASAERGDQRAKSSRRTVLALCRTICSHIAHSSRVAEMWLSAAPSISSSSPFSISSSSPSGCHLLAVSLSSMLNFWSEEGDICAAGLFELACSPSSGVHAALLQAGYVSALVGGVVELLAQLPPVSVSPPIASLLADHAAGRALSSRLQAIDALCLCGPASVVLPLCSDFRVRVLDGVLAPLLSDVREDVAGWATMLLCHIVKRTDSQSLARSIAACLLAVSNTLVITPARQRTQTYSHVV